jgi:hypothetical protein
MIRSSTHIFILLASPRLYLIIQTATMATDTPLGLSIPEAQQQLISFIPEYWRNLEIHNTQRDDIDSDEEAEQKDDSSDVNGDDNGNNKGDDGGSTNLSMLTDHQDMRKGQGSRRVKPPPRVETPVQESPQEIYRCGTLRQQDCVNFIAAIKHYIIQSPIDRKFRCPLAGGLKSDQEKWRLVNHVEWCVEIEKCSSKNFNSVNALCRHMESQERGQINEYGVLHKLTKMWVIAVYGPTTTCMPVPPGLLFPRPVARVARMTTSSKRPSPQGRNAGIPHESPPGLPPQGWSGGKKTKFRDHQSTDHGYNK